MVAHSLRAEGFDASEDGTGRGTPLVPVAWSIMPQNSGKDYKARAVCVRTANTSANGHGISEDLTYTLDRLQGQAVITAMQVRRLTVKECEKLQGFPPGYTDIKPRGKDTPDGPRYKALGNSMAVPVMRWIGERIQKVEDIK